MEKQHRKERQKQGEVGEMEQKGEIETVRGWRDGREEVFAQGNGMGKKRRREEEKIRFEDVLIGRKVEI